MTKKRHSLSTQRLTTKWELVDIPDLEDHYQTCWKLKCLARVDEFGTRKSIALDAINKWEKFEKASYNKLMRALIYAGCNKIHLIKKYVEPDKNGSGIIELRNARCKCRVFGFYHRTDSNLIIFVNAYWKGQGHHKKDQEVAFANSVKIRDYYLSTI